MNIWFESFNRKWNGVPNSHPNSSKRRFHCFNLVLCRQSHMYNYFCTDENNEVTTCILTQSICTCLCQPNRMNTCKWLAAETVQIRQMNKQINHWPCVQWIQIQQKKVFTKVIMKNTRSNQVVYIKQIPFIYRTRRSF